MRLTCPNCGAQYEVPDEVIPQEGRDVQCSNCGTTWFQPSAEDAAAEDQADDVPLDADPTEEAEPETAPAPQPRQLDPGVADILKEEAERETVLRKAERSGGLESQPDLGLETMSAEQPEQQKETPSVEAAVSATVAAASTAAAAEPATRRELLPDIEEINSSLRSSDDRAELKSHQSALYEDEEPRRGGFLRGFVVSCLIVGALILVYANAPAIARAVPQTDPMISSFVALVDQGRFWLDAQVGSIIAN
ncbi:zinc-ribbon domain-containing protein [Thalassococcus sp. S3]|uniref:zinc-ribbon domain-containing protein n=1 Tax=Thalassococcus sp. S3 TaxID=2017482 RepID=UPI001024095B|nr:zinc-ribbon domain-containing protein [Thalassococcus sp. S3]QBF30428.1 hypothetical protein CFI11_04255 [Thalassococcus sp. S3]